MSCLDVIQAKATTVQYKHGRVVAGTWKLKLKVNKAVYSVVSKYIVSYIVLIWHSSHL